MRALICWLGVLLIGAAIAPAPVLAQTQQPQTVAIPRVAFPHQDKTYTVTVASPVIDGKASDYWLVFADAPALHACTQPTDTCKVTATPLADHEVQFSGIPGELAGVHTLTVQVANSATKTQPVPVTFSIFSKSTPLVVSLLVMAVIGVVLVLLLNGGGWRVLSNGTAVTLARAMFIDPETSTYSLAKLQFYVWTFAGLAGWLYLSFARSLVQGSLELSDVPSNLPGIVAISVGTGVISSGVATVAGSKGSGDFHPSCADFITSGGVVAPERLQYLLWTIVGGVGFLLNTLLISPADINDLPAIPSGFLALMGISAGGYLGGKLARGAGPNIRAVVNGNDGAAILLTVDGTGLSARGASFLLAHLPAGEDVPIVPTIRTGAHQSVIDAGGNIATRLVLGLPAGTAAFAAGDKYRLTIVNPDGEKSAWEFTAS
jgi:hypothetical protein